MSVYPLKNMLTDGEAAITMITPLNNEPGRKTSTGLSQCAFGYADKAIIYLQVLMILFRLLSELKMIKTNVKFFFCNYQDLFDT